MINLKTRKKHLTTLLIFLSFALLSVAIIYFSHIYQRQIFHGDDIEFHKNRIEGLLEAIKHQDFFPRINYSFMKGMGYGTSLFYSDIFLYPAALFRLLGLSLSESVILYTTLLNFVTFVISYFSFKSIKNDIKYAFLFSVLYTLSTYRLGDVVVRAAFGEFIAFTFLPLGLAAILNIIYYNGKKWFGLTICMTFLFYSHLLTAVLFTLLIFGLLCLNLKPILIEKARRNTLIKATSLTLPLVIIVVAPMLEQAVSQVFRLKTVPSSNMWQTTQPLTNYVEAIFDNVGHLNLGLSLVCVIPLILINYKKLAKSAKDMLILTGLFTFISSSLFPWYLAKDTFLNTIQFPWRFFILITLCLTWIIAMNFELIFKKKYAYSGGC